jgi:hypothetical protein
MPSGEMLDIAEFRFETTRHESGTALDGWRRAAAFDIG